MQAKHSVMIVGSVLCTPLEKRTIYYIGFILVADEKYCLVLSSFMKMKMISLNILSILKKKRSKLCATCCVAFINGFQS